MTTEKGIANEKRKYPRYRVDLPIKYSKTNFIFKYGRATNASEGGIMAYLPEEIETGQDIALKLFFPSFYELNPLEIVGQVVWTDIHLRRDWGWDYQTGVKFINISPEDKSKFKKFLMSLSSSSQPYQN